MKHQSFQNVLRTYALPLLLNQTDRNVVGFPVLDTMGTREVLEKPRAVIIHSCLIIVYDIVTIIKFKDRDHKYRYDRERAIRSRIIFAND